MDERRNKSTGAMDPRMKNLMDCSVTEILSELGNRFNIRFGELRAKYHNRQPSTKIVIDHKVEKEIE